MLNPRLTSLLILITLLAAVVDGRVSAADERPNVVIILCDDLGYGDLACYGHPTIRTPNLDRLAAEGLRLTDCYSASPLCSPARAGLMTGRTPSRTGIYSWIAGGNPMNLRRDETTIATLLRDAGYDTCHVGKWHLNGLFNDPRQTQPGDHGFEHWFATQNNASPSHKNPRNFVRNGDKVGPLEGFSCGLVVDEAIGWLTSRQVRAERLPPFFMFVCFHEPHEPVASPADIVAKYPNTENDDQAQYFANVENMDLAVGQLMKTLDNLGDPEETLVFFTSDNGPETLNRYRGARRSYGSPGPLRGMKLHIYDGGIRVAGITRWPGHIEAGSESGTPVSSVDLLPTVCELADVPLPTKKRLDGTSIVPVLRGKTIERKQPLFWHYYGAFHNRQTAIRDGDWKLVAGWDGDPSMSSGGSLKPGVVEALKVSHLEEFELYNLREDIAEAHNLADAHPKRFAAMKATASRLYHEVIDEGPRWEFPKPVEK